jgi:polar amino acid transport system substrate-binding protein
MSESKRPDRPATPVGGATGARLRSCGAWLLCLAAVLALGGCSAKPSAEKTATSQHASLKRVKDAGVLRWGADVVGGVPYVYEDPKHPGQYIGFEMDIASGIASALGVKLQLVVKAWDTLIPELQRGSFDMAMNGIEDTPDRARIVQFSDPYYIYSQQITVRKSTKGIETLADLKGKHVATLSGTAAEDILRGQPGVIPVVSPEIIYSYRDLEAGKVDAVLLDKPIAVAYGATNPKLQNVGESFNEGRYVIVFRTEDTDLKDAVNAALEQMKRTGALKAIYQKYGLLDAHQVRIGVL